MAAPLEQEDRSEARMLAPNARRLQVWLHAADVHDCGALFLLYALLVAEVVAFADYLTGEIPSSALFICVILVQFVIVLAHTLIFLCDASAKSAARVGVQIFEGDSSEEEATTYSEPPLTWNWQLLRGDVLVGIAYTLVTVACLLQASVDVKDVDRLGLALTSYAMYLTHALGGSFFLSLLKSSLAGDADDVSEALEPLLSSPPLVSMSATCGHCEKRGKKSKGVVTHKATEWVPFVSWRDITKVPGDAASRDFTQISVMLRLCTDVNQERSRFQQNHTKDVTQTFNERLSVAGFDSSVVWKGLWCPSTSRLAAARVAMATACLCSVPVRLAISRRTSHLVVVVRKQVSWIPPSGTLPGAANWQAAPQVPRAKGQKGNNGGWTFSRAKTAQVDPPPAPPNLTLYDYAALWSDRSPGTSSLVTSLSLLAEVTFAVTSSRSRLLGLICWTSLPFLGFLETLRWRAFAKNVLKWSATCTYCLVALIILGMVISIAALATASLWVSVQWDLVTQRHPMTTVRDLSPERMLDSWSFYLADGYVDLSATLSSHQMCGKRHNAPCRFVHAAPIFESFAESTVAGTDARAWAVSGPGYDVRNAQCGLRGGLCGLVATRVFHSTSMSRLHSLVTSKATSVSLPLAMVYLVDPEEYFAGIAPLVWNATIYIALLLFLGIAASHANRRALESASSRQVNMHAEAEESWDAIHERSALLSMALADTAGQDDELDDQ